MNDQRNLSEYETVQAIVLVNGSVISFMWLTCKKLLSQ